MVWAPRRDPRFGPRARAARGAAVHVMSWASDWCRLDFLPLPATQGTGDATETVVNVRGIDFAAILDSFVLLEANLPD